MRIPTTIKIIKIWQIQKSNMRPIFQRNSKIPMHINLRYSSHSQNVEQLISNIAMLLSGYDTKWEMEHRKRAKQKLYLIYFPTDKKPPQNPENLLRSCGMSKNKNLTKAEAASRTKSKKQLAAVHLVLLCYAMGWGLMFPTADAPLKTKFHPDYRFKSRFTSHQSPFTSEITSLQLPGCCWCFCLLCGGLKTLSAG